MKPSQAAELVAALIVTYPWVPTAKETSAAYERGLDDLDHAVAQAAVDVVNATHAYPNRLPTVAEIRAAALTLTAGEVRTGLEAWGDVERLMRRGFSTHRPPKSTDLDDPIVFGCIQDIGWRVLCMTDEDDSSPRARFIDSYDKRAAAARRDTLTRTLPSVRAVLALRAGEEQQRDDRRRIDAGSQQVQRAVLQLVAHPAAADSPEAQRAIRAAQHELRKRGTAPTGAIPIGELVGRLTEGGVR